MFPPRPLSSVVWSPFLRDNLRSPSPFSVNGGNGDPRRRAVEELYRIPEFRVNISQHEQLSRAKDNKSSKKKDSSQSRDQGALGISQSASPNHGTPTSSTTSVNDTKGRSPDNAAQGLYPPGAPGSHYLPQGGQPGNNGPATPTKQGGAPSVVISPSAPVSASLAAVSMFTFLRFTDRESMITARTSARCRRDHAGRSGTSPEIQRF